MKFRRIRTLLDRAVQFGQFPHWIQTMSEEKAEVIREKDQAFKDKK